MKILIKIAFVLCIPLYLIFCGYKSAKTDVSIPSRDSLKIISFNIRYDNPKDGVYVWNNRKNACAEMIKTYSPDVLGVQEALDNQIEDLEKLLPQYARIGEAREPGGENNEYSAIFYKKDKYEFVKGGTFWLSETPEVVSRGWDAKYNRIATWVHLKDLRLQKEFLYLNTHLDHRGKKARIESARLIVKKMKEVALDSLPVFVSGDFNALPNDTLFTPLKAHMKDVRMEINPADSTQTTNGWGKEAKYKVIDYIFFNNAEPTGYKVITDNFGIPFISDHYPIIGTFVY